MQDLVIHVVYNSIIDALSQITMNNAMSSHGGFQSLFPQEQNPSRFINKDNIQMECFIKIFF